MELLQSSLGQKSSCWAGQEAMRWAGCKWLLTARGLAGVTDAAYLFPAPTFLISLGFLGCTFPPSLTSPLSRKDLGTWRFQTEVEGAGLPSWSLGWSWCQSQLLAGSRGSHMTSCREMSPQAHVGAEGRHWEVRRRMKVEGLIKSEI